MLCRPQLRMTCQRRVILEELGRSRAHPTADELYARVRRRLPHVSLGTVYRNLQEMADRGLVRRLTTGGTQKRFDGDASEHHHVRCVACGRVSDAGIGSLDLPLEDASRASRYEVTGYRLELLGYCPRCKRRKHRLTAAHV